MPLHEDELQLSLSQSSHARSFPSEQLLHLGGGLTGQKDRELLLSLGKETCNSALSS